MANRQIRGRNSTKFRTPRRNQKNIVIKKRLPTKVKMQDARQKILQKKRKTVVDARDILAKMAKTQDARSKINKLRENRNGIPTIPHNTGSVKVIGANILRKTDRNGKITLVTNKTKNTTDMNLAIQKQLGLLAPPARPPVKKVVLKRNAGINTSSSSSVNPLALRKTIVNDVNPLTRMHEENLYKYARTASQIMKNFETQRQIIRDDFIGNGWHNYSISKPLRLAPTGYVDLDAVEDEEMPLVPSTRQTISLQGPSRISNVHSRLDTSPIQPESHGILSQTKTKVVVPVGHRIVVSNLQSTVTQDDIKELFEDIGQLLAARLVRPGVAEVIYKNLKDAQKAVDTYHNRQLDGQPMKCLLVNKRPLNQPTAPALSKSDSQSMLSMMKSSSGTNSNALVPPDISTIHKVLFQRK